MVFYTSISVSIHILTSTLPNFQLQRFYLMKKLHFSIFFESDPGLKYKEKYRRFQNLIKSIITSTNAFEVHSVSRMFIFSFFLLKDILKNVGKKKTITMLLSNRPLLVNSLF
jgi:hypothetical protein